MLNRDTVPSEYLKSIKRHLSITFTDADTDQKLLDMMMDAEVELNHILGAEIDYFKPGMERKLYKNYMLYAWNDCLEEFEDAYRKDIIRIRKYYKVKRGRDEKEKQI